MPYYKATAKQAPTRVQTVASRAEQLAWDATVSVDEWVRRIREGYRGKLYNVAATNYYRALVELRKTGAGGIGASGGAPTPPSPAPVIPSVFHGRGMLATWNTEAVFRDLAPYLDWIALLGRLPETTLALADAIRSTGVRVLVWEDEWSNAGIDAVTRILPPDWRTKGIVTGYIGQGESAAQRASKIALGNNLDAAVTGGIPKALVDNLDPASGPWPPGWVCIPEVYEAANPNANVRNMVFEAKQRGATQIVPCYQLYVEGSQTPVWLDAYLEEAKQVPEVAHGHWCGYSLLTEDGRPHDMDVLKNLGRVR